MAQLDWQRAPAAEGDLQDVHLAVAAAPDGRIHMRVGDDPDRVVTTTRAKWEAFINGVKAGEFDDFAAEE
jgi:predicted secreted Zn-dependent protease